jgi:hypothetical protein
VVNAVSQAVDALILGSPQAERWLKDPRAFDNVVNCFVSALKMFRPDDNVTEVEGEIEQFALTARTALVRLMARAIDAYDVPVADRTYYQHLLALLASDLGPLSARPIIHEMHSIRCPLCRRAPVEPAKEEPAS